MKFRKKPVVIEARQFTGAGVAAELIEWCDGKYFVEPTPHIAITTMEGVMSADLGDWIIQGVKGEYYPCKPDIFEATYEPVEE